MTVATLATVSYMIHIYNSILFLYKSRKQRTLNTKTDV